MSACPLLGDGSTVAVGDYVGQALRWVETTKGVPSTLFGVTVLGYPDQLVEIEAVAAVVD